MSDTIAPWLVIAGLGAFHGINPAMGWLFAVALGLHRQSRRVVWLSLLPIAAGHAPIKILHLPAAHTDGDSIVFFRSSDVISVGGVISSRAFPSFDPADGGSVNGLIDALNRILDYTVSEFRSQGGTTVITADGRLYDEADVAEYRDMLVIIRDRIQAGIDAGASLPEVLASRPALDYEGIFGASDGPWTTEDFVTAIYRDLGGR